MGSPQGQGVIGVEVLRWWHISSGTIPFHFSKDPPNVVFRMTQVHQLALIRCFKDRVSNLFPMGQQTETPLPLS